jgi:D-alanyl-lipoteichoic acid acyltransferase DltB (MBOAT superfamily)
MLFNSYEFLLLFLPICLIGYFQFGRFSKNYGAIWLALCSIFFYAWWDYRYILLLSGSIIGNYHAGRWIAQHQGTQNAKRVLIGAITANLGLLAYYKYADFFILSANHMLGSTVPLLNIALPIGISFFTFTQIAFLADAYQGKAKEFRFSYYVLFVTYFPHLIAGPVLHHKEMMPQFDIDRNYSPRMANFQIGLTIFIIGLCKKVLIADSLAGYATPVFAPGANPGFFVAWGGLLAYSFQLYFDFSGYSDMAIGLSRLFGIKLPLNFNSPYKAANITDFWRRWHMTLSRFLRDYLYVPLGGNRKGPWRRKFNLVATMLLGGLWHGAGWTFVIWGGLHGLFLIINHAWQETTARFGWRKGGRSVMVASVLLTFLCTNIAWVFFRAPDVDTAFSVLRGIFGLNGAAIPAAILTRLDMLQPLTDALHIGTFLGGGANFIANYLWIAAAAFITFAFPNTQELLRRYVPALPDSRQASKPAFALFPLRWRPTVSWAVAIGLAGAAGALSLTRPSEFLYFQF